MEVVTSEDSDMVAIDDSDEPEGASDESDEVASNVSCVGRSKDSLPTVVHPPYQRIVKPPGARGPEHKPTISGQGPGKKLEPGLSKDGGIEWSTTCSSMGRL